MKSAEIKQLRAMTSEQIMNDCAVEVKSHLRPLDDTTSPLVVIPAWNEQEDLPRTLLQLSKSYDSPRALVVDNGSEDKTAEYAHHLGAFVIHEDRPTKRRAMTTAFDILLNDFDHDGPILLTDADTLVTPSWAGALHRLTSTTDQGRGAAVNTTGVYHQEGKPIYSMAVTAGSQAASLRARMGGKIRGFGPSMAISVDRTNQEQVSAITRLADRSKEKSDVGSNYEIVEAIQRTGGSELTTFDPALRVHTSANRYKNMRNLFKLATGNMEKEDLYPEWNERINSN